MLRPQDGQGKKYCNVFIFLFLQNLKKEEQWLIPFFFIFAENTTNPSP